MGHFASGFFLMALLNLLLLLAWPALAIAALFGLRKSRISETARALWALLIAILPVLGPLAFWIVRPNDPRLSE